MTPSNRLLHLTLVSASHCQRSVLLKEMRTKTDTHNWTVCSLNNFGTPSHKWDAIIIPPFKAQGSMWKSNWRD